MSKSLGSPSLQRPYAVPGLYFDLERHSSPVKCLPFLAASQFDDRLQGVLRSRNGDWREIAGANWLWSHSDHAPLCPLILTGEKEEGGEKERGRGMRANATYPHNNTITALFKRITETKVSYGFPISMYLAIGKQLIMDQRYLMARKSHQNFSSLMAGQVWRPTPKKISLPSLIKRICRRTLSSYLKRLSRESVLRIILIWMGPAQPNLFSKTFVNSDSLLVASRSVRFELRSKVSQAW